MKGQEEVINVFLKKEQKGKEDREEKMDLERILGWEAFAFLEE
jgi:hypothetical protein